VKHFSEARLHYPAGKIRVIPNAVDMRRFEGLPNRQSARRMLGLPAAGPVLTCVASLTPQKGHRYLVDAMRGVTAEREDALLLLAGDGSLRGELEAQVQGAGLAGAVRFLGTRSDIPQLLAATDVFVLPSLWEGLPVALAEAGAAGLPAVATAVDGSPEVVADGETGLLIAPHDEAALTEAMLELLRDPDRAAALDARRSRAHRARVRRPANDRLG
jgi:glycosyltransferase involved in cell wall biosynthesis